MSEPSIDIPSKTIFTVGSDVQNDIVLTGRYIEAFHAKIEWQDGNWVLYDLSKNFGVTINSDPVREPTVLHDRSYVKIATHVLHWKDEIDDILHPKASEYYAFYWSDLTKWKGLMDKKSYRLFLIPWAVAHLFVMVGSTFIAVRLTALLFGSNSLDAPAAQMGGRVITNICYTLGFGWLWYVFLAQTVKRARDTRLPWWKFFIPLYNIYLLLFRQAIVTPHTNLQQTD